MSGYAEMTTVAFGPGERAEFPGGCLLFGAADRILTTDLAGLVLSETSLARGLQEAAAPHVVFDNELVKLPGGALVYSFEAVTWDTAPWQRSGTPLPAWAARTDQIPLKGQQHPAGRGRIYVFRSTDVGKTWTRAGDIDAAYAGRPGRSWVSDADLGTPRLFNRNAKGEVDCSATPPMLSLEAGGWDAHCLYADPHTGNLYLSVGATWGQFTKGQNALKEDCGLQRSRLLLFASYDQGDTWTVIGDAPGISAPRCPVTSNSEMIAFAFPQGSDLRWTTFRPYASFVDLPKAPTVHRGPGMVTPLNPTPRPSMGFLASPTLLGVDTFLGPAVFISTFSWVVDPVVEFQFNIGFDLLLNVGGAGEQSVGIGEIGPRVTSEDPRGWAMYGTFVEGPRFAWSALYYWVEASRATPAKYSVRGNILTDAGYLLRGARGQPEHATLSRANGKAQTWEETDANKDGAGDEFMGDYHGGASYRADADHVVFVAPWVQDGRLMVGTITVREGRSTGPR